MNVKNLIGAVVLGLSASAMAAVEDPGFYVGTGLGEAEARDAAEFGLSDDTDTAFRVYGGYTFSPLLTAEVGYLDLGEYRGEVPGIGGPATTRVDLDGFTLGMRPQLALNQHWYAQAQVGLFLWDSDAVIDTSLGSVRESDDGEDLYYGLGIGRDLGSAWQVSGEWTRFETDASDVDFLNLSLTYRIGQ